MTERPMREDLVEIVARYLCEWAGWQPEEKLQGDNLPTLGWMTFRKDARELLRAIEGAGMVVERGWQPIDENTPRDRNLLMAHEVAAIVCTWDNHSGGWITGEMDEDGAYIAFPVTHWMELPPLPAFDAAPAFGGGE